MGRHLILSAGRHWPLDAAKAAQSLVALAMFGASCGACHVLLPVDAARHREDAAPTPVDGATIRADSERSDAEPTVTQPLGALEPGDGRLWLGRRSGGATGSLFTVFSYTRADRSWREEPWSLPIAGELLYFRNLVSSSGDTAVAKSLQNSHIALSIYRKGQINHFVAQDSERLLPTTATVLDFDIASEQQSGDVLLVFGNGQTVPHFRLAGSDNVAFGRARPVLDADIFGGGSVLWVELIERPNSNEIALLYADDRAELRAVVWDGTHWKVDTFQLLETDLKVNPTIDPLLMRNRAFDGAYETASGQLQVVWGRNGIHETGQAMLPPGGIWTDPRILNDIVQGQVEFIDLAADPRPGSNYIAAAFVDIGNRIERLGLGTWNGEQWLGLQEYDSEISQLDDAPGDAPAAVAWTGNSGQAVCVYADRQPGSLDWYSWSADSQDSKWIAGADEDIPGKTITESVVLRSVPLVNHLVAVFSDSNRTLFAASYDGQRWQVATSPLAAELTQTEAVPFSFGIVD